MLEKISVLTKKINKYIHTNIISAIYLNLESNLPKNNVICFISYPDYSDNSWEFFKYLYSNNLTNATMVWLVTDVKNIATKIEAVKIKKEAKKPLIVKKNSLTGVWYFLRAKNIFFTHGTYSFVKKTSTGKLINLWHGMPIKSIAALDENSPDRAQECDRAIATSPFFAELMAGAFNLRLADVITCGQPRCDAFFQDAKLESVATEIFVGKPKAYIVWMPTYRLSNAGNIRNDGVLSIDEYRTQFINQLKEISGSALSLQIKVIVKLHPMDILNNFEWVNSDNVTILRSNNKIFERIELYTLLSASTALVTDISSVAIDYLLLNKPMFVVWPKKSDYKRALLFDSEMLAPYCTLAHDYSKINDFIRSLPEQAKNSSDIRKMCVGQTSIDAFHPYKDGASSARLANLLSL